MLKNSSKKGFLLVKIDFAFLPTTFIVYWVLVHCRVGSLERLDVRAINTASVHCRVGRLKLAKIITPEIHQTRKV